MALFCTFNCFAQTGWFWQNPTPTGNDIYRIKFVNNNIGFAAGSYGTVIKTYNGGANWINVSTGSKNLLTGMYFLNFNTGFVAGLNSTIFKTTNGGSNWINCSVTDTVDFESIVMFNSVTGIAISSGYNNGSGVFRTTNSGINWVRSPFPGNTFQNREISMTDSNNAFIFGYNTAASGGGYILKTSDKGSSWNQVYSDDSLDFFSAYTLGSQQVTAMATSIDYYYVVKTTNGGSSWSVEKIQSFDRFGITLKKIAFVNSLTGYCAGYEYMTNAYSNRMLKTTDGGLNWQYTPLADSLCNLNAVEIIGNTRVVAGGQGGFLIRSVNSGASYSRAFRTITTARINDVSFIDNNTGIIVCSRGEIYKTLNSGNSWQRQYIDSAYNITCCKFVDINTAYIATSNRVYKTINGGANWLLQLKVSKGANWIDIDAPNTENCRVVGSSCPNGNVYTTNGGNTWEDTSSVNCQGPIEMEQDYYTGLAMPTPTLICFIGGTFYPHAGSVPKAWMQRNGGSLNQIYMGGLQTPGMISVDFLDSLNGFVSGDYKARLRTTDGGFNWVDYGLNLQNGNALSLVRFGTPNILYAKGGSLKSTNGGANWFDVPFITEDILGTDCISQNVVVSVGSFGKIIRTNLGGVLDAGSNNSNIPVHFELFQNYPNPFNPVTKIRFYIPSGIGSEISKLVIYDILGREVKTLLNEIMLPGNHEVSFDGTDMTSGVYFYRFTSGDFSETKKMVLIK